jgi:DNA internalization-related competence protein ComEC/Rec2
MRVTQFACCTLLGILPLLWLPVLPSMSCIGGMIVAASLLLFSPDRRIRFLCVTVLLFCWGALACWQVQWPAQELPGKNRSVEIVLSQTDGQTTHQGWITHLNGQRLFPAPGITLYGNYLPEAPCAGQRWAMTIRVRAVHGQLNESGFDSQRYALAQHQPVTGRFIQATLLDKHCSLRSRFLSSLRTTLADISWRDVLLALGLGERLSVDPQIKLLMQQTGTSHLMAISGLHIALGASLGWLFIRGLQFFMPCRAINWRLPMVCALVCAFLYAWLTGLQPPAVRTVVAAGIWTLLRLSGRRWTTWEVWLCCIAAILIIDPISVLSDSLWLSVFAVATLIFWYQWVPLPRRSGSVVVSFIKDMLYVQSGLMLLLIPLQIALFHGISLTSLLANLVAVPVVTFVVVPLVLLGMFLHLTGPSMVEHITWSAADSVMGWVFAWLRMLPEGWLSVDERWGWASLLPWLMLIVWRLHAWLTFPALYLSASVMLMFPLWRQTPQSQWQVTMLDVGQGLAVVISRQDKAVLYDTGLAWPGGDSSTQLIIPWLRWHNLKPEGIILSHEHLDHRGGLDSIHRAWPSGWIRSPLGWAGHQSCKRGDRWQWQGLSFQVLWPLAIRDKQGNNGSCVVRVDDGQNSVLLTGDIELSAEMAMQSHYWQHLMSTIIQVPHHGSNTSSGVALLQQVGGRAALASASRYNAWRLPSEKVKARYLQHNYAWFDTPHQGQITITFSGERWKIEGLRDQLLPRWYHQWFGEGQDNG